MKKIISLPMVLALLLTVFVSKPAKAASLMSVVGPVVGIPVGAVAGTVRGMTSKGLEYTDSFPGHLGLGIIGKIIGIPAGLAVGGVTGGVTGLVKGSVTGLTEGIHHPLSEKSMSLDGDFVDYDPYTILH